MEIINSKVNEKLLKEYLKFITQHKARIWGDVKRSWNNFSRFGSEPLIVKEYITGTHPDFGINYLNNNLCQYLNTINTRYTIKFASVFIHQKPYVERFKDFDYLIDENGRKFKGTCELGDMATLLCLIDENKNPIYTSSTLLQAKRKSKIDNFDQQCLYDFDEKYRIKNNLEALRPSAGIERFLPKYSDGRANALNYLILEDQNETEHCIIRPPFNSSNTESFHRFIYQMLTSVSGLAFNSLNNNSIYWDGIMIDLLNIAFNKNNISGNKVRSSDINELKEILSEFNDFNESANFTLNCDNESEGFYIILIIINDKKTIISNK